MALTNTEILRGVITQGDVGTPGAGLLSPEQFDAFWVLAETQHPWATRQFTARRKAHTGGVPRIDFGDDVIEAATEAVDTGNFTKPSYDNVPYAMTKGRVSFAPSRETVEQAASDNHEDELVSGFTRAFGRSFQKLAWLGDTASANPTLKTNDGWLKQIKASGNVVDGSLTNGGVLAVEHFYDAIESLPLEWQQRANELAWAIGTRHKWVINKFLSNRATGMGDDFIARGVNGQTEILGIPLIEVPSLTTDLVLTSPPNTTVVVDNNTFRLEKIDQGLEVKAQDIIAYIGFFYADFILREVEGIAVVEKLTLTSP